MHEFMSTDIKQQLIKKFMRFVFGKKVKRTVVMFQFNNEKVSLNNFHRIFNRYFAQNTDPSPIHLTIKRKEEIINLKCDPFRREDETFYLIAIDRNALQREAMVRNRIKGL